jgi:hypothetical protein
MEGSLEPKKGVFSILFRNFQLFQIFAYEEQLSLLKKRNIVPFLIFAKLKYNFCDYKPFC